MFVQANYGLWPAICLNFKSFRSEFLTIWGNSLRTEICQPQVFFDLMREIRARKNEQGASNDGKKEKRPRKKIKCSIL